MPFHKDVEEETGIFAMLILQLPTEQGYEGGEVVVKHNDEVKTLDCHMVSAVGFCCTVFFADCLLKLQNIKSGTNLCLAFPLVKRDFPLHRDHEEFISRQLLKAEAALEPWFQERMKKTMYISSEKLAIPLQHFYTDDNLCLKGNDSITAKVLENCKDKTKEKRLDLHLCLASQKRCRDASPCDFCGEDCFVAGHHREPDLYEEEIEYGELMELNGSESLAFKNLDMERVTVVCEKDAFDEEPVTKVYDYSEGSSGPSLEFWSHKAFLVIWPKALSITIACEVNVSSALDLLERTLEISDPKFGEKLHDIVWYLSNMMEDLLRIIKLLSKFVQSFFFSSRKDSCYKIGVRNAEVAKAIAGVVQIHGWESFSSLVIDFTKGCAVAQGESFVQLTEQLICMGNIDAGALVAQTAFGVFETRINAERALESQKMPEWTWRQPLARIPKYPDIEEFLRGPEKEYVQRGFKSLSEAISVAGVVNNHRRDGSAGYSAIGTPGGEGDNAFCEIQKIGCVYKASMEKWLEEQEAIKRLLLLQEKLRSAVSETNFCN